MNKDLKQVFKNTFNDLKVAFVSPFPPRKCGIAMYTRDLIDGYENSDMNIQADVFAMIEKGNQHLLYPRRVKSKINRDLRRDYILAAQQINKNEYDVVHIQHEFGLFGGENGDYILDFINNLKVPFIITFHTILSAPEKSRKSLIQKICRQAKGIIVMTDGAVDLLSENYLINRSKIYSIHHGVPELFLNDKFKIFNKFEKKFKNNKVIGTFGFIGPNKGLEYLVEAMPEVIKNNKDAVLVIAGSTHPVLKRQQGDKYLKFLMELAEKCGVKKNTIFIQKFLTESEIAQLLFSIDIYVTPYLEQQQISSGTLTYAYTAGKPLISTPYSYATELIGKDAGYLVPFRNSKAIAGKINYLLSNFEKLQYISVCNRKKCSQFSWNNIATIHFELIMQLLERNNYVLELNTKINSDIIPDVEKFIN